MPSTAVSSASAVATAVSAASSLPLVQGPHQSGAGEPQAPLPQYSVARSGPWRPMLTERRMRSKPAGADSEGDARRRTNPPSRAFPRACDAVHTIAIGLLQQNEREIANGGSSSYTPDALSA